MSVKEFFAFSCIKPQVIEYLKNKADFNSLHQKYKKPFRGHILSEDGQFFISDGFNQIQCEFSDACKAHFLNYYPPSLGITELVDMLICVENYQLNLQTPFKDTKNINNDQWKHTHLKLVLTVDQLKVISFDQFSIARKLPIDYD